MPSDHDPLCDASRLSGVPTLCDCRVIARARADERARLRQEVTSNFTRYDTRDIGDAYHAQSIDELLAEGVPDAD